MNILDLRVQRLKKQMIRKIELLESRLWIYSRRDSFITEEIEDNLKRTNMQLLELMTVENTLWLRSQRERTERNIQQAS